MTGGELVAWILLCLTVVALPSLIAYRVGFRAGERITLDRVEARMASHRRQNAA